MPDAGVAPGTIRGDLGTDSLTAAEADGRLVENLIHSSDDAAATCRDFGTWYGANRHANSGPTMVNRVRPSAVGRPVN